MVDETEQLEPKCGGHLEKTNIHDRYTLWTCKYKYQDEYEYDMQYVSIYIYMHI